MKGPSQIIFFNAVHSFLSEGFKTGAFPFKCHTNAVLYMHTKFNVMIFRSVKHNGDLGKTLLKGLFILLPFSTFVF